MWQMLLHDMADELNETDNLGAHTAEPEPALSPHELLPSQPALSYYELIACISRIVSDVNGFIIGAPARRNFKPDLGVY